ncbi:MAG: AIR synthase-related protein, partial [Bacteroidota bacterium]
TIFPTPVIGMLGLIEDTRHITPNHFRRPGDLIVLLGRMTGEIGGSQYLFQATKNILGDAPEIDLKYERRLQLLCLELATTKKILSAHNVSEGGIAVALVECCLAGPEILGAIINKLPIAQYRKDFALFGENQSRILVTVDLDSVTTLLALTKSYGIDSCIIGEVTNDERLRVKNSIDISLKDASQMYHKSIPQLMGEEML